MVLNLWQDRQDRKHELAILEIQMELQKLEYQQRYQDIRIEHDMLVEKAQWQSQRTPSTIPWVEALRSSVRPILTYAFFLLFSLVKFSALWELVFIDGQTIVSALPQIWDEQTHALFSAIIAYWFGARALSKYRGA